MKKLLVIGLISASFVLGGCLKQEATPEIQKKVGIIENIQSGAVQTGSTETPKMIETNSGAIEQISSGSVFGSGMETESGTSSDQISFSDSQIQDILAKIEEISKKQQEQEESSTGILVQGDFKAEYIPSKDNIDDKIKITINGKENMIDLTEINTFNKKNEAKIHDERCKETDLPTCFKHTFSGFSSFYNKGKYLGYNSSQGLIIIGLDGKKILTIGSPWICNENNTYLICSFSLGDGEIGIFDLGKILDKEVNGKYSTGLFKERLLGKNSFGFFQNNNHIYTKQFGEKNYFKVYDSTSLEEIFSKELIN